MRARDQLGAQGYRLVDVSGYELNGNAYYAAIRVQSKKLVWVPTTA